MPSKENDKPTVAAAPAAGDRIQVPEGDVLLRRIGGPDGNHAHLGRVKIGRVYTVAFDRAVKLTGGEGPEFEAVYTDVGRQLKQAQDKKDKDDKAKD